MASIGFAEDMTVELMPHEQFIHQRAYRQPPLLAEQDQRIDVRRVVRQYQMCRLVPQQLFAGHPNVVVPVEEKLNQFA